MMKGKIQNWLCFNFKCAKLHIPPANETIYITCQQLYINQFQLDSGTRVSTLGKQGNCLKSC